MGSRLKALLDAPLAVATIRDPGQPAPTPEEKAQLRLKELRGTLRAWEQDLALVVRVCGEASAQARELADDVAGLERILAKLGEQEAKVR